MSRPSTAPSPVSASELASGLAPGLVPGPGTPLYVHLPYCVAKCTYCDFYSVEAEDRDVPAVVTDLLAEAAQRAPTAPRTVFLGGGTPSLLAEEDLARLLDGLDERTGFRDSAEEVSVECNPESLSESKARRLLELGATRLSVGVQSLEPRILQLFGRVHDVSQSFAALDAARRAGCTNLSVDLIYAVPGQDLATWLADLERVLEREPEHISAYNLAFEKGTLMTHWLENGTIQPQDEEAELAFFEATRAALARRGYEAYEVSNFSLNGYHCHHNENYWENGPYIGLGPSAVSKVGLTRFGNPRSVTAWSRGVRSAGWAVEWEETPPAEVRLGETWWLGLRTARGVDPAVARSTADFHAALDPAEDEALELASQAFLERRAGHWRLTPRGLPLADAIALRFLADPSATLAAPLRG